MWRVRGKMAHAERGSCARWTFVGRNKPAIRSRAVGLASLLGLFGVDLLGLKNKTTEIGLGPKSGLGLRPNK